jgi:HSP20 family protein
MTLERWQPGWSLRPWRPFHDFFTPSVWRSLSGENEWLPAIEMLENEDSYVIKAEMPGVKEKDIDVSMSSGVDAIEDWW